MHEHDDTCSGFPPRAGRRAAAPLTIAAPAAAGSVRRRTQLPNRHCVIEAGWALTHDGERARLQRHASIAVQGGRIAAVRASRMRGRLPRIDATPLRVVPGIARRFPIWQRRSDEALHDSVADTLAEIEANRHFALEIDGAEDGRIRPMMAPHAADTHTPETLRALVAAARQLGHGIHRHLCQGRGETEAVQRVWGAGPVAGLEQHGVFGERVFGAHPSAPDLVNDPAILRRHRFAYATCPSGGGAGGFTRPWPELLAAGVNTNVGIDTHSNDHVENLKLAVIKGEARWSPARASDQRASPTDRYHLSA